MFSRHSSRIAHRSDSSSSEGSPSPCLSPSTLAKPPPGFPLRRKFQLSFLRFRISSLLRMLRSMTISCRQALYAILLPKKPKKKSPPSKPRMGMAFSAQCTRSACAPDAIADCIEFIKKSSFSSCSSDQPSSPSLSSPFSPSPSSPSLSSPLLSLSSPSHHDNKSRASQYPHSCLHHESSLSSPLSHNYISLSPCY